MKIPKIKAFGLQSFADWIAECYKEEKKASRELLSKRVIVPIDEIWCFDSFIEAEWKKTKERRERLDTELRESMRHNNMTMKDLL